MIQDWRKILMTDDREARIRQRAYEFWETAGQPEGRDQEYWLLAEASVAEEEQAAAAPKPRSRKPKDVSETVPARRKATSDAPRKPRRSKASETLA